KKTAEAVHNNTWKPELIWWGMDKDMVRLSPVSDKVPDRVKNLVEEKKTEIIAGVFQVFSGPLRDQNGTLKIPAGTVMTDPEMLQMDFFVEGVQGNIPEGEG
ncbi:MAG: BMP family ABC transporter substrate-binding protein, partial [Desulfobacterales bacterium]|nr:BMP family ABC transporter substrate-binding protein [Desulfobacterales bacterium]